jgi:hypothetical protein
MKPVRVIVLAVVVIFTMRAAPARAENIVRW